MWASSPSLVRCPSGGVSTAARTTLALAEHGYWDEAGQYWYLWPADQVYEESELRLLVIGGPGVDGIEWGYRAGQSGVWAYYPFNGEFVWLAPTADALLQGWLSGSITV